jgi:inactive STAND
LSISPTFRSYPSVSESISSPGLSSGTVFIVPPHRLSSFLPSRQASFYEARNSAHGGKSAITDSLSKTTGRRCATGGGLSPLTNGTPDVASRNPFIMGGFEIFTGWFAFTKSNTPTALEELETPGYLVHNPAQPHHNQNEAINIHERNVSELPSMTHQHSSLDQQVDRRNLLGTLKSLSKEDLHELCVFLIPASDRPNIATDIRTLAVAIFEWAEALTGCGLYKLAQEVEMLTGQSCIHINVDIIQELRYLDFQDQINESNQHLFTPDSKAFIIHSPRESVYCWLLKRFFIPFGNQPGSAEEPPKTYRFPMASLSSSIFDEMGIWGGLYRQLGYVDSFCHEQIPQILHLIEMALYSSKVFFIIDGIETTDEKFVIGLIEKFWLQIVDRLIQIKHPKRERLFLFLVDSSHGGCHGYFPPGHPPAKSEWTTRGFVSLSRTQAIRKKDFDVWLGCNPHLFDSPKAIQDMADTIYGAKTDCEIDEIAEVLAKFVPAQRDKILGMLKL